MKKLFPVLLILVSLISCEKDSALPTKMSAFINGDSWKSVTQISLVQSGTLSITGTDLQGRIIEIVVHGDTKGTYNLSLAEQQCACVYKASISASPEDAFASVTGSVTLTSISSTAVSGTFDFVCKKSLASESVEIKSGQFTKLMITAN
jgi:hypothetical protein